MITRQPDGTVEFRVFATGAERVQILGSFTGWEAEPIGMTPCGGGWFTASVRIEPGDHEFQYLIDGQRWLADYGASGVRHNEYGLWVSQLCVPERASLKLVVETRNIKPTPTPAPGGTVLRPVA